MTPNPATLAAGLSEAGRREVLAAKPLLFGKRFVLSAKMKRQVTENLRAKGICEAEDIYRDRLTPLGLALRAYLQDQTG